MKHGRQELEEHFSREKLAEKLERLFLGLVEK
jgi:hypothetical protein